MVDELRHLDGIKGNFYVSEIEYLVPASFHDNGKPASEIIYSNLEELVQHQQYVFDMLWDKSIPAEEKIREIDEGIIISANLQVLQSTQQGIKRAWDMVRSATEDVFVMFSTANAFRRQVQMGILQLFQEKTEQHYHLKIKILIPTDQQITETVRKARLICPRLILEFMKKVLEAWAFSWLTKKNA